MTDRNSPMDQDQQHHFQQERQEGVHMQPTVEQNALWAMMHSLRTVVDELQQTRQQRQGQSHGVRPPKPDHYDGKRNAQAIESWLFMVKAYCNLVPVVGEAARVEYATTLLRGDAIKWWRQLVYNRPSEVPNTWDDFAEALRKAFRPRLTPQTARLRLDRLKHRGGGIEEFTNQFRDAMMDVEGMSLDDALYFFYKALKPGCAEFVMEHQHEIKDMEDAYTFAEFHESARENSRAIREYPRNNHSHWQRQQPYVPPTPTPMELDVVKPSSSSSFGGKCFKCGERGHRKRDCPNRKRQQESKQDFGKAHA